MLKISAWTGLAVVVALAGPVSALAAPSSTPPDNCNSAFNPYDYTEAAVDACGYKTFPLTAVHALPGGGKSYEYDESGAPLIRVSLPPSGFTPATATDAQLQEYGFPSRPPSAAALSRWQHVMNNWRGAAAPTPFLAQTHARALTVDLSDNWAGYGAIGSYGTFNEADIYYVEPYYYGSSCPQTSAVVWAGIDGGIANENYVFGQIGTAYTSILQQVAIWAACSKGLTGPG